MDEMEITLKLAEAVEAGRVVLLMLGNPDPTDPTLRPLLGVPVGFKPTRDGRDRVVLRVSEDSEQLVLIERVRGVFPAPTTV